jgi:hypothetical protein
MQKKLFFILKVTKVLKESDSELDPDPLVRRTDLRIRIRTKISRIPNTDLKYLPYNHIEDMNFKLHLFYDIQTG